MLQDPHLLSQWGRQARTPTGMAPGEREGRCPGPAAAFRCDADTSPDALQNLQGPILTNPARPDHVQRQQSIFDPLQTVFRQTVGALEQHGSTGFVVGIWG